MDSESVAIFLAVARNKSFTAAASQMFITKQMVSRAIQSLEQELHCSLITRSTHSVGLTQAGRMYRDFFARHADDVFAPNISSLHRVSVAIEQWIEMSVPLVEELRRYEREHNCLISILRTDEGRSVALLLSGKVDFVISSHYTVRAFKGVCSVHPFCEQELRFMVSSRHPLATAATWAERERIPLLASYAGESGEDAVVRREKNFCRKLHFEPQHIRPLSNHATVLSNIILGAGAAFLPIHTPNRIIIQIPTYETVTFALSCRTQDSNAEYRSLANSLSARFEQESDYEK